MMWKYRCCVHWQWYRCCGYGRWCERLRFHSDDVRSTTTMTCWSHCCGRWFFPNPWRRFRWADCSSCGSWPVCTGGPLRRIGGCASPDRRRHGVAFPILEKGERTGEVSQACVCVVKRYYMEVRIECGGRGSSCAATTLKMQRVTS